MEGEEVTPLRGQACAPLSSSHGEPGTRLRVREAHTALPGEGAT